MSSDRYTKSTAVWGGEKSEYRYSLKREWFGGKGKMVFIMLNPSTADEKVDDPTVRRCMNRAMSDGYGCCEIVNLFAIRGTDPKVLKQVDDPVGPENDKHIERAVKSAKAVVIAWGNHGQFLDRNCRVLEILSEHMAFCYCYGLTGAGEPKHPLYQRKDQEFENFPLD